MKVKKSSSKANYAAKNAPAFCEISFINKGKRVWTRDASEGPIPLDSLSQPQTSAGVVSCEPSQESMRLSVSLRLSVSAIPESPRSRSSSSGSCSKGADWIQDESVSLGVAVTGSPNICFPQHPRVLFSLTCTSSCSRPTYSERMVCLDSDMKVNEEILHSHFTESSIQVEATKKEALQELRKRRKLEAEAIEVISKVFITFLSA